MLIVDRVIQVRCTICKEKFTYQDEAMIPKVCPACMDGKIVQSEEDALDAARKKREYAGTATIYKKFNV